jgi:putative copper resistance protein D
MTLPPDLIAFLAAVLRGGQLAAQALVVGGTVFLIGLAEPLASDNDGVLAAGRRWTARSAVHLLIVAGIDTAAGVADEMSSLSLDLRQAMGAQFVQCGLFMMAAAGIGAVAAGRRWSAYSRALLAAAALAVLFASLMSSHAAARLDHRGLFLLADFLHQAGAAAWIGGIPFFLMALARVDDRQARYRIGRRFSQIAATAVACLAVGAALLARGYIGSVTALVGTAYGAMVAAKAVLLAVLLLLGFMNMLAVRRLPGSTDPSLSRLRRFAEVEIGIGMTVMFIAASLATQPPAADQMSDPASVASMGEIVDRITPHWPRLTSPPASEISLPGDSWTPAANEAADRAWSEFNHHWSGLLVLAIGLMTCAERTGRMAWARHWPLLFLVLAAMLFVRSDPESWPLGPIPFFERLADPEVLQHRLIVLLVVAFALFEWSVRLGRLTAPPARLVFPVICAVGGALLLVHSHSLADVKQRYLIELTHIPMGLLGIGAGWARWLEERGDGRPTRIAGWIWPVCFVLIGLLLIDDRET